MANDEHVALLKQGVDAWNRWRDENPGTRPDLSEANLREANLSEPPGETSGAICTAAKPIACRACS